MARLIPERGGLINDDHYCLEGVHARAAHRSVTRDSDGKTLSKGTEPDYISEKKWRVICLELQEQLTKGLGGPRG